MSTTDTRSMGELAAAAESERESLIGSYAKASALLDAYAVNAREIDPGLVDLTERLAIRLLVKHHRWVMTGVGEMRKVG